MPDPLTIGVCPAARTITVALGGELDLAAADRLYRVLMACASTNPERLEVDLGGLAFIDSWGAQALVRARQDIDPRCAFRLRGARRLAAFVLGMVGFDSDTVQFCALGRAAS